jgi:hypothetical protein
MEGHVDAGVVTKGRNVVDADPTLEPAVDELPAARVGL